MASAYRDLRIESVRGIACILLVSHHSMDLLVGGGYLTSSSFIYKISTALSFLRMPLFTFLSGYVYAIRPTTHESMFRFNMLKLRRLGLPILFIEIPFCILSYILGSENKVQLKELLISPIYPIGHFWFLNALILIFAVVSVIDSFRMMDTIKKSLFVLCVSLLLFSSDLRDIKILALGDALYIMPFFILGTIVYRFTLHEIKIHPILYFLCFTTVIFYPLYSTFIQNETPDYIRGRNVFYCIISMGLCYFTIRLNVKNKLLAYVGTFSYTIYLYHVHVLVFIKGFTRKISGGEFIASNSLLIASISGIMAIFVSIMIHTILSKNRTTSLALLGVKKK